MYNLGFFLDAWKIGGASVTIVVTTMILLLAFWIYSRSLAKAVSYQAMSRFSFVVFSIVRWAQRNVDQMFGSEPSRMKKFATCFSVYTITFLWLSNVICILGFDPSLVRVSICFSLGILVFLMTIVIGLVYRGKKFFGDYVKWIKFRGKEVFPLVDPLKLLSELSKVLSISCRLWGNTLAGSLILFALHAFALKTASDTQVDYLGPILIPFFVFPLHIYFDVLSPALHGSIFTLLTIVYWSFARHGEGVPEERSDAKISKFID